MAWVVTFWYQFAGGATVEGEGKEHHGIEAIHAWRSEVADTLRYDPWS
jgi:hypothetical protein